MIGVFVDCFRQHFRSNFKCRKRFIVKMKVEGLTLCNIGYKYIFRPIIYYLVMSVIYLLIVASRLFV